MKTLIATAFIASAGLALASSAHAMPIAPLDQAEVGAVIQVFGGCGWGGHRGPFGGCRPLYNCPRGWHTGPWGLVCRPLTGLFLTRRLIHPQHMKTGPGVLV
jgi:hypothetical protein